MILTEAQLKALIELANDRLEEAEEEELEDDEEEEDEEEEEPTKFPPLVYEVQLYKNPQSQQLGEGHTVVGSNISIVPISELSSALVVVNEFGQAVYTVPWDMVASIKTRKSDMPAKVQALTAPNK